MTIDQGTNFRTFQPDPGRNHGLHDPGPYPHREHRSMAQVMADEMLTGNAVVLEVDGRAELRGYVKGGLVLVQPMNKAALLNLLDMTVKALRCTAEKRT